LETAKALLFKCVKNVLLNQAFIYPCPHNIENFDAAENHPEIFCPPPAPSMFRVYRARDLL